MQEQPKKPMIFEKKCHYCDKLLQKYSEDRSQIESFVYYWYYLDGHDICSECKELKEREKVSKWIK